MGYDQEIRREMYRIARENSEVARYILFGSRARGDANSDSDWDILVIINTDKIKFEDYNKFADPFYDLGLQYDAVINPILHTAEEWTKFSYFPLFQNIQREGVELC